MKIKLFVIIFLVSFLTIQAQNEASIWYFGENAGLDFTSGIPVALTDGELNTFEGCSTISDANGQLLFYTDGITVWDKNHNIMPNGTDLLGDPSSTQSGIIVPKPNDPNIYYVFTVDLQAGNDGLRYSEVDLSLNSGNGDINENKNILLSTPITEKISAVVHENGVDIWVITHEWNSANFLAYRITPTGINLTPVVSTTGTVHQGIVNNTIGYLKFSPDGKRLALANTFNPTFVEIFDFDTATGLVSNPIPLSTPFFTTDAGPYGIEFSPSSELLYVTDVDFLVGLSRIHQFDITLTNAVDIINSDTILFETTSVFGALQLALDCKIYVAVGDATFLGAIENPNIAGLGANYVHNAVDLNGRLATFGLPTFIQSYFSISILFENVCLGTSSNFILNTCSIIDSVLWNFGDGNTSTSENPTHNYAASGDFNVNVTITSGLDVIQESRVVTVYDAPIVNAITDYILCDDITNDDTAIFDLTTKDSEILGLQSNVQFNIDYYPTQLDAENNTNVLASNYTNTSNSQEIFSKIYNVDNNTCYAIASFNLVVSQYPIANSVNDIVLCDDASGDEEETINLSLLNTEVLNGQTAATFNITYHLTQEDAVNNTEILPNNYQSISQTIFVRIENSSNPMCFETTSFSVTIDDFFSPNQPDNMFLCDDESNDGVEAFDLVSLEEDLLNGLPGNYNVSYYLSQGDADSNVNVITSPYENSSNAEEIFIRIEKTTNVFCYQTLSFFIEVKETPVLNMETEWSVCTNETIIIVADSGYDNYLWSTGETTASIEINSGGVYTVTATNNYATVPTISCSNSKTITVTESSNAVFNSVEIVDWTIRENEIIIFVDGIGDYEYSLDGVTYQDSNLFSGLMPGEYTIFVRDKLGCGVIEEEVFLLFYPFFFTPNNDTVNDFWQIKFSESEPNLEIFIFDRYGKLLTTLNPRSRGWDGTFHGKLMPATDYWFLVKRPNNGKEYTGHFALKR
ncbi:T9SS type B sorting domain-containing protein [Lacinutrix sp.]|uniref:T9SS type B sorting domain-containing protein n=1 Tax=Lacinutrix sp. TaxID=1937692 RepID=UPI0025C2CDD5|nr:T9SS type B sorting domain-containing protein [Lacinutrix sp.]